MCSRELLLVACLGLLGGLRLTSTTTTTTLVAAMSIANQDLERYFRSANVTQNMPTMTEERILLDTYTYAYIKYTYMENNERKVVNLTEDQARYGEGKHLNVMGKLVHITDANNIIDDTACSLNIAGTGGSPTPAADTPWIALVRRGHCTFEEKVRNVYEKGAIGVIIYNDKIVMSLEKMQIKGKTRNITAVITYQNVGNEMVDILNQGNDVFVSIMTGSEGSRPVTALNRTSVLFVSVSFIVLMLISLVWLIFYYIQRFRYLQTKDQHSRQLCSVTKKAIMKIPTKTGKSSDEKDIDGDCCAICIEAYKSSDCIRVLPCKHEFHKHCIDPWLIEHRTCPMCKLDVLKFYGYVFLGSEESILEYDSRSQPAGPNTATSAVAGSDSTVARPTLVTNSALTDLIRSRDFVVDFPRVFILEVGSATGTHGSLFPARLPERSQSAMSLACAKDWMLQMTNKLDEQHGGLRRLRKASVAGDDMHENLLSTRTDSVNKRRSRSADGRYSNGYFGRKELALQLAAQRSPPIDGSMPTTSDGRRGSTTTLYNLTEARYAQSTRRRDEQPDLESTRHGRPHRRRDCIEIPLMDLSSPHTSGMDHADQPPSDTRYQPTSSGTNAPLKAAEGHITIQLNGEGIDLE